MHRAALLLLTCLPSVVACGDDAGAAPSVIDGGQPAPDAAALSDASTRDDASPSQDAATAPDAAADAAVDCAEVLDDVLLTCGNIVCHDPFSGGIGTVLNLSMPAALPDSLFGLRSSDDCGAVPYLNAAAPEQSLLILKLDDDPPCGDRMPAGDRPPLDAIQRTCFVEWVLEAAGQAHDADAG